MYVKLFQSIYDGSLATRGPWEALVTFQQLLVLSDRTGIVDMTTEAISRRTTVPLEIIERGIVELEKPDPDSRKPDFEGRRILRLDPARSWGWQVVNYEHYRRIRTAEDRREYMRQYMREKREPEPRKRVPAKVEGFDAFWSAYPRRVGRGQAEKAWRAIGPELHPAIMQGLKNQAGIWNDPKFIPYPATWLNGKRWEDDATANAKPGSVRPSITCDSCGERVYTWTGSRCDPCWRKSQAMAA